MQNPAHAPHLSPHRSHTSLGPPQDHMTLHVLVLLLCQIPLSLPWCILSKLLKKLVLNSNPTEPATSIRLAVSTMCPPVMRQLFGT